jgi:hypothetical protein
MAPHTPYKNESEMRQHQAAISQLAQNLHASEVGVKPLYEIILSRFNRTARIREYLSVLVSRQVKDYFKKRAKGEDRPLSDFEARRSRAGDL